MSFFLRCNNDDKRFSSCFCMYFSWAKKEMTYLCELDWSHTLNLGYKVQRCLLCTPLSGQSVQLPAGCAILWCRVEKHHSLIQFEATVHPSFLLIQNNIILFLSLLKKFYIFRKKNSVWFYLLWFVVLFCRNTMQPFFSERLKNAVLMYHSGVIVFSYVFAKHMLFKWE